MAPGVSTVQSTTVIPVLSLGETVVTDLRIVTIVTHLRIVTIVTDLRMAAWVSSIRNSCFLFLHPTSTCFFRLGELT